MQGLLRQLKKVNKIWIVIVISLVVLRMLLPVGIKYGINWYLGHKLENYQGHIDDFDLELYRSAYQIQGLKIWKKSLDEKLPLVAISEIDLSLAWRALFKGHLLGDLTIKGPRLNFVDSADKSKQQFGDDETDWKVVVGKLVPIELETLKVVNGEVRFVNQDFKVPVEVIADEIDISATNIKNTEDRKTILLSDLKASARLQKDAKAHLQGKLNLISRVPAFDLSFTLKELDLTKFNKFFLAYGPFTFTSGKFSMYSEVASKDNKVAGYVKPFIENADVIDSKEKYISSKQFFVEMGVAIANLVVRDFRQKNAATKIEFSGDSKDPEIDKWGAFWGAIKNGFGTALKKKLDNSISIKDVPKKKNKEKK